MFEKISEVLDVEHEMVNVEETSNDLVVVDETSTQVDERVVQAEQDFDFARDKIKDALEQASKALESMVDIANNSEHPRAFEVLSTLANNVTGMAESLVKLHKDNKAIAPASQTVNNQTLVMTTEEVIKLLRG